MTDSQRRDVMNYHAGQYVEFHGRATGGFKSGERWEVMGVGQGSVKVSNGLRVANLPLAQPTSFQVYAPENIALATGDQVRATKNVDGTKNNELYRVSGFANGHIELVSCANGKAVQADASHPLHLDQGMAVTNHASQGKTVDQVIASVPVSAFSQTNEAQFYVSMSRAKYGMHLLTDSKAALREAVCRPSDRLSPSELLSEHEKHERIQDLNLHAGARFKQRQPDREQEMGMER